MRYNLSGEKSDFTHKGEINMLQSKKRITSVTLVLALLFGAFWTCPTAAAADDAYPSNALIIIGDKIITNSMTLDDVIDMFGEPKIMTDSLFGGKTCTFYGDNYSDYLYIDTNDRNKIVIYGSIADDFRMKTIEAGQASPNSYYVQSKMDRYNGTQDVVCGALDINYYAGGIDRTAYTNLFTQNICAANKNMIPHSVAMFNAATELYGYNTPVVYDEDVYDRVLQLAENGNNPYNYAQKNNRSAYERFTSYGSGSWILHPMVFASHATGYTFPESKNLAAFVNYKVNTSTYYYCGSVSAELFVNTEHPVALTAEEQVKLQNAMERYQASVNTWNGEADYYDVEPSVRELPIEPGVIKDAKIDGAIGFINSIRAGAGLKDLTRNDDLVEGAQAKAAYTRYLGYAGISNNNPHTPPQAEGISDEFYQKTGIGSSENLFIGNVLSSISNAIDDGYGDPIYCGHRRNLIDPYASQIGLGSVENQSAHKFYRGQSDDIDFVCWPSKGITPSGAVGNTAQWTIWAYNGYIFNNDTYVTIRLLNKDNAAWTITRNDNNNRTKFNRTAISFYNENLALTAGYVYEVTLHNVTKTDTLEVTDYTYRAAIANLYSGAEEAPPELTLDQSELNITEGEAAKLHGSLDPNGSSKYTVEWTSSDPTVATVSPCGMVTAKKSGTAVITAVCGTEEKQCVVTVTANVLMGDADGDGNVNINDATLLQKYIAHYNIVSEITLENADTNDDGLIDIRDVTEIQRYLIGLRQSLG